MWRIQVLASMADGRSQGAEPLHVIAKSILQLVPKWRSVNICEPCRGITRRCLGCGDTCGSYGFSKLRSLWEGCIPMDPEWRIVSKRICRLWCPWNVNHCSSHMQHAKQKSKPGAYGGVCCPFARGFCPLDHRRKRCWGWPTRCFWLRVQWVHDAFCWFFGIQE